MKVTLTKEYKKYFTLEDLENAKEIIRDMKDDESTAAEYAKYAIDHYLDPKNDYCVEVLKASAEVLNYYRAHDVFNDHSNNLDIMITATAKTRHGYIEIMAYISDIWQTGEIDYRNNIYAEYFTKENR